MSPSYEGKEVAAPDTTMSEKTYNKIYWRILPFLAFCYMFAYLDRINVGFAKLQMQQAINLSDAAYGVGAGIFFLGYVLFEIPSNLYISRIGAKKTLFRIMFLWGLTSSAMMFVSSPTMFYILRFMLGMFEAGFYPGVVYYLTLWFPDRKMAKVMAIIAFGGPIGSMIGGPVSTWLMTHLHNFYGLDGWQWMFLVEGVPCIILGVVAWFYITDTPQEAKWLTVDEKNEIANSLNTKKVKNESFLLVLKNPSVYGLIVTYFGLICGIYAMTFWLPTILQSHGIKDIMSVGILSSIPYITTLVFMVLVSKSSEKHNEVRWHISIIVIIAAISLLLSNFIPQFTISMALISIATALIWSSYVLFWSIPSKILKGQGAAGGIAFINSCGLIGGFISPSIIGWIKQSTGSLTYGLIFMAALLGIAAVTILFQTKDVN